MKPLVVPALLLALITPPLLADPLELRLPAPVVLPLVSALPDAHDYATIEELAQQALADGDLERARTLYRHAAQTDHPEAAFRLARLHHRPPSGTADLQQAYNWYARAGNGGHVEAAAEAGLLLLPAWPEEARAWLQQAIDGDSPTGHYGWGRLQEQRAADAPEEGFQRARPHYEKAARAGLMAAQLRLGAWLAQPDRDPAQARLWLELAATQQQADAQRQLARLHAEGLGGPRNWALATYWAAQAARQGDDEAARLAAEASAHLRALTLPDQPLPLHSEADHEAPVLTRLAPGSRVFLLGRTAPDFLFVYEPSRHWTGQVAGTVGQRPAGGP